MSLIPRYTVLARRYRPQRFSQVVGQVSIVQTLKNALLSGRIAQAYLFSGMRGTGKTTLARILAKAFNCTHPIEGYEPCNECASCSEINEGISMDVIEIDGASNRGIEDIRRISENIAYAPAHGKYRIYIIDEVHMLTKDAFNALLKTLEEPPAHAKFFFATTEAHRVLPTILSRCQRFELQPIAVPVIMANLQGIATEQNLTVDDALLERIAILSEGGLRDAQSIFDQLIAYGEGTVTVEMLERVFGIPPIEIYFRIDRAVASVNLKEGLYIVQRLTQEGKDLNHFYEGLLEHLRTLLLFKIDRKGLDLSGGLMKRYQADYEKSASIYTVEQLIYLLDLLLDLQVTLKSGLSQKITLETILLRVLRSSLRVTPEGLLATISEQLVRAKEGNSVLALSATQFVPEKKEEATEVVLVPFREEEQKPISVAEVHDVVVQEIQEEAPSVVEELGQAVEEEEASFHNEESQTSLAEEPPIVPQEVSLPPPFISQPVTAFEGEQLSLDTLKEELPPPSTPVKSSNDPFSDKPVPSLSRAISLPSVDSGDPLIKERFHYDNLLYFTAVELNGSVKRKGSN